MHASFRLSSAPSSSVQLGRLVAPLVLALVTVWLIWPAFAHSAVLWRVHDEFSFGFLVPPISFALVWWRREVLRRSVGPGASIGLVVVAAALGLYLFANRLDINALAGFAVSPLLWGMTVYLWGWGAGRVLAFPIFFLAFGLTLYRGLLESLGFAMQKLTAVGSASIAGLAGVPVVRDGLYLTSDQFSFVVAQECSGMSSLVSLLTLAALWAHLARGKLSGRLGVLLSVLPLVLVANTTRVTLVLLVAWWFGQDAALGFFHGASSLVLFGVALAGLLFVSRMVGCKLPSPAAN